MPAYLIADVETLDQEGMQYYRRRVGATLEPYGGKFVVRGGRCQVLEGDWETSGLVLIEFPSIEQARQWYDSPEYQKIIPMRLRHARTSFLALVEGV